ncbi:MAG: hypothetical protein ACLFSV_13000, partial [Alkalispirochaeta sp.]
DGTFFASHNFLGTTRYLNHPDSDEGDLDSYRLILPEDPSDPKDSGDSSPRPRSRFDTGTDPEEEEEPPSDFDPFSGGPAPSS